MTFTLRDRGAHDLRPWVRWAWQCVSAHGRGHATAADLTPPSRPELSADEVRRWRLEPLFYGALSLAGDPRARAFAAAARETTAINLIRPAAIAPVMRALQKAGVRYAIYKGAALTDQFSELRTVRSTSDVDVLVLKDDFHAARMVLTRLGFEEQRSTERVSIGFNNERVFIRYAPMEMHIDLHNGLHRGPLFRALSRAAVLEASTGTDTNGLCYAPPTLAPLLIAAHRAKHGFSADGRELLDLRVLFENMDAADFDALVARAAQLQMQGALYGLWTVYRWWWGPGGAFESRAYATLRANLGHSARWIENLVAYDSPGDANKPWSGAPFLKMYLPMPLLTGHRVSPLALAGVHVGLRTLDVLVGGTDAMGPLPPTLRTAVSRVQRWVKR